MNQTQNIEAASTRLIPYIMFMWFHFVLFYDRIKLQEWKEYNASWNFQKNPVKDDALVTDWESYCRYSETV